MIDRSILVSVTNARISNKSAMQATELHPVPVPSGVSKQVRMDLIGPVPKSRNGNQYISGLTDYFSKLPIAIPFKSAGEVVGALIRAICTYGYFETLVTDQDRKFVNHLSAIIFERLYLDHRIASAYHTNNTIRYTISIFIYEYMPN